MKKIILISILLSISGLLFSQQIALRKAELILESQQKTDETKVQVKSSELNVQYINNQAEIKSEGKLMLGSLTTTDHYLQELINDYSSTEIEFSMIFKNEQFIDRSNIEFSYKSVMQLNINNIVKEITVTVIVSNSKSSQSNYYIINVSGEFLLSDFDVEITSLKDKITFLYKQNATVRNS